MCFAFSNIKGQRLRFHESILECLAESNKSQIHLLQDSTNVSFDSTSDQAVVIPIGRSCLCPLAKKNQHLLPEGHTGEAGRVFIPVATVCLLETPEKDGVFLTRRSQHLRSYPGLWVPPGGHCEPSEPLAVTAVRELCEELGFERQVFENFVALSDELVYPLCAWEATYSCGVTVKSHHLVIYYVARWPSFLDGYVVNGHRLPTLRLQLDEVQAAACLPSSVLRVLVQDWLDCEEYWQKNSVTATDWNQHAPLPNSQKVNAMTDIVWSWNQTSEVWTLIPVNRIICGLTSQLPSNNEELLPDRVNDLRPTPLTTGTLYALSHWLSSQSS